MSGPIKDSFLSLVSSSSSSSTVAAGTVMASAFGLVMPISMRHDADGDDPQTSAMMGHPNVNVGKAGTTPKRCAVMPRAAWAAETEPFDLSRRKGSPLLPATTSLIAVPDIGFPQQVRSRSADVAPVTPNTPPLPSSYTGAVGEASWLPEVNSLPPPRLLHEGRDAGLPDVVEPPTRSSSCASTATARRTEMSQETLTSAPSYSSTSEEYTAGIALRRHTGSVRAAPLTTTAVVASSLSREGKCQQQHTLLSPVKYCVGKGEVRQHQRQTEKVKETAATELGENTSHHRPHLIYATSDGAHQVGSPTALATPLFDELGSDVSSAATAEHTNVSPILHRTQRAAREGFHLDGGCTNGRSMVRGERVGSTSVCPSRSPSAPSRRLPSGRGGRQAMTLSQCDHFCAPPLLTPLSAPTSAGVESPESGIAEPRHVPEPSRPSLCDFSFLAVPTTTTAATASVLGKTPMPVMVRSRRGSHAVEPWRVGGAVEAATSTPPPTPSSTVFEPLQTGPPHTTPGSAYDAGFRDAPWPSALLTSSDVAVKYFTPVDPDRADDRRIPPLSASFAQRKDTETRDGRPAERKDRSSTPRAAMPSLPDETYCPEICATTGGAGASGPSALAVTLQVPLPAAIVSPITPIPAEELAMPLAGFVSRGSTPTVPNVPPTTTAAPLPSQLHRLDRGGVSLCSHSSMVVPSRAFTNSSSPSLPMDSQERPLSQLYCSSTGSSKNVCKGSSVYTTVAVQPPCLSARGTPMMVKDDARFSSTDPHLTTLPSAAGKFALAGSGMGSATRGARLEVLRQSCTSPTLPAKVEKGGATPSSASSRVPPHHLHPAAGREERGQEGEREDAVAAGMTRDGTLCSPRSRSLFTELCSFVVGKAPTNLGRQGSTRGQTASAPSSSLAATARTLQSNMGDASKSNVMDTFGDVAHTAPLPASHIMNRCCSFSESAAHPGKGDSGSATNSSTSSYATSRLTSGIGVDCGGGNGGSRRRAGTREGENASLGSPLPLPVSPATTTIIAAAAPVNKSPSGGLNASLTFNGFGTALSGLATAVRCPHSHRNDGAAVPSTTASPLPPPLSMASATSLSSMGAFVVNGGNAALMFHNGGLKRVVSFVTPASNIGSYSSGLNDPRRERRSMTATTDSELDDGGWDLAGHGAFGKLPHHLRRTNDDARQRGPRGKQHRYDVAFNGGGGGPQRAAQQGPRALPPGTGLEVAIQAGTYTRRRSRPSAPCGPAAAGYARDVCVWSGSDESEIFLSCAASFTGSSTSASATYVSSAYGSVPRGVRRDGEDDTQAENPSRGMEEEVVTVTDGTDRVATDAEKRATCALYAAAPRSFHCYASPATPAALSKAGARALQRVKRHHRYVSVHHRRRGAKALPTSPQQPPTEEGSRSKTQVDGDVVQRHPAAVRLDKAAADVCSQRGTYSPHLSTSSLLYYDDVDSDVVDDVYYQIEKRLFPAAAEVTPPPLPTQRRQSQQQQQQQTLQASESAATPRDDVPTPTSEALFTVLDVPLWLKLRGGFHLSDYFSPCPVCHPAMQGDRRSRKAAAAASMRGPAGVGEGIAESACSQHGCPCGCCSCCSLPSSRRTQSTSPTSTRSSVVSVTAATFGCDAETCASPPMSLFEGMAAARWKAQASMVSYEQLSSEACGAPAAATVKVGEGAHRRSCDAACCRSTEGPTAGNPRFAGGLPVMEEDRPNTMEGDTVGMGGHHLACQAVGQQRSQRHARYRRRRIHHFPALLARGRPHGRQHHCDPHHLHHGSCGGGGGGGGDAASRSQPSGFLKQRLLCVRVNEKVTYIDPRHATGAARLLADAVLLAEQTKRKDTAKERGRQQRGLPAIGGDPLPLRNSPPSRDSLSGHAVAPAAES